MKKKFYIITSLIIGLVVGLVIAARFDFSPPAQTQVLDITDNFKDAVVNVANTSGKAVVSISTERTQRLGTRQYYYSTPFDDFFGGDEFFRRFFDEFFGQVPQREFKQRGLGSGTIIDAQVYILTNEHVISGADKIVVTLSDGRKFDAQIQGKDSRSDLAVIKINARNLPATPLGDSDNLRIGDWVVVIGNPFGFALENPEPTVPAGVVSALHRSLGRTSMRDRNYNDLIQTDAAINPGNSGGPLVNLKGEVIGINVAIFTTSGGYQGVGFAIPINNAKRIISRLIAGKKILYGWLGVTVQDVTEDLAQYFGLPDTTGALVAGVLENSPAEKARIQEGDVIRKFAGQDIESVRQLLSVVSKTEAGQKVKVVIWRDRRERTVEVQVTERPEDLSQIVPSKEEEIVADTWRGITVEQINAELAKRFGLTQSEGVVIVDVEPGSPAYRAGLMPGDVIIKIEGIDINSLSDYQRAISRVKGAVAIKTPRGFAIVRDE